MKDKLLKNFKNNIEAEVAKNILESAGIKSVVQRKGTTNYGNVGEASLFVLEKDYEEAIKIISELKE